MDEAGPIAHDGDPAGLALTSIGAIAIAILVKPLRALA
jgi:hypothetical protein